VGGVFGVVLLVWGGFSGWWGGLGGLVGGGGVGLGVVFLGV